MQTNASVVENVSKIAPVVYCQLQMTARIFVSVLPIRTFVSDVKDVQDFVQMMPSRSRRATRENIIGLPSNQDFGLFLQFF